MRGFVAVDLPAPVPIVGWERGAGAAPPHLTLRFLGEVDVARRPSIDERLAAVAARHGPFPIRLAGVDAFPDRERPRIVYLGVTTGRTELVRLAGDVESELGTIGFPRERRPFRPHVTLGRIRSAEDVGRFERARAGAADATLLEARVDAIVLKVSELGPGGAQHHTLARWVLTGPEGPPGAPSSEAIRRRQV